MKKKMNTIRGLPTFTFELTIGFTGRRDEGGKVMISFKPVTYTQTTSADRMSTVTPLAPAYSLSVTST